MATKKKTAPKAPPVQYATVEQFNELNDGLGKLLDLVESRFKEVKDDQQAAKDAAPTAPETKHDKEVSKAAPYVEMVNPAWKEKAEELLGDALERCEVFYPRNGGTVFTLVIKKEKSNAAPDYFAFYKEDRRSKEIGNEGIEGVENWCKLVKENLKRPRS